MEKEFRKKESNYKKQEAVMQQKIELMTMQMQEMEERETNQKQMYDKLFTALDEKGANGLRGLHAASSKEILP